MTLRIKEAHRAITSAIRALRAGAPNARNYYVQGDTAFSAAKEQYTRRMKTLAALRDSLQSEYQGIIAQRQEHAHVE